MEEGDTIEIDIQKWSIKVAVTQDERQHMVAEAVMKTG